MRNLLYPWWFGDNRSHSHDIEDSSVFSRADIMFKICSNRAMAGKVMENHTWTKELKNLEAMRMQTTHLLICLHPNATMRSNWKVSSWWGILQRDSLSLVLYTPY